MEVPLQFEEMLGKLSTIRIEDIRAKKDGITYALTVKDGKHIWVEILKTPSEELEIVIKKLEDKIDKVTNE
jgi:hypothetical protein